MPADFDEVDVGTWEAATITVQGNVDYSSYEAAQAAADEMRDRSRERATHRPGPYRRTGRLWEGIQGWVETGPAARLGDLDNLTNFGLAGVSGFQAHDEYVAVVGVSLDAVPYARRLERGFYGVDSIGRRYHQHPYPYLEPPDTVGAEQRIRTVLDPPLRKGAPGNGPPFPPVAPSAQAPQQDVIGEITSFFEGMALGALSQLAFIRLASGLQSITRAPLTFLSRIASSIGHEFSRFTGMFRTLENDAVKLVTHTTKDLRIKPTRSRMPRPRVKAAKRAPETAQRAGARIVSPAKTLIGVRARTGAGETVLARTRTAVERPARSASRAMRAAVVRPARSASRAMRAALVRPAARLRTRVERPAFTRRAVPERTAVRARSRMPARVQARARQGAVVQARGRQGAVVQARARTPGAVQARARQGAVVQARGRQGAVVQARGRQGAVAQARARTPGAVQARARTPQGIRFDLIPHYFQGVQAPRPHGIEYSARGWERAPVERINIRHAYATQHWLSEKGLEYHATGTRVGNPRYVLSVRQDGKTYILDGHHRVASALRRGDSTIIAKVQHGSAGAIRPRDYGRLSGRAEVARPARAQVARPARAQAARGEVARPARAQAARGKPPVETKGGGRAKVTPRQKALIETKRAQPTGRDLRFANVPKAGPGKVVRSSRADYPARARGKEPPTRTGKGAEPKTAKGRVVRNAGTERGAPRNTRPSGRPPNGRKAPEPRTIHRGGQPITRASRVRGGGAGRGPARPGQEQRVIRRGNEAQPRQGRGRTPRPRAGRAPRDLRPRNMPRGGGAGERPVSPIRSDLAGMKNKGTLTTRDFPKPSGAAIKERALVGPRRDVDQIHATQRPGAMRTPTRGTGHSLERGTGRAPERAIGSTPEHAGAPVTRRVSGVGRAGRPGSTRPPSRPPTRPVTRTSRGPARGGPPNRSDLIHRRGPTPRPGQGEPKRTGENYPRIPEMRKYRIDATPAGGGRAVKIESYTLKPGTAKTTRALAGQHYMFKSSVRSKASYDRNLRRATNSTVNYKLKFSAQSRASYDRNIGRTSGTNVRVGRRIVPASSIRTVSTHADIRSSDYRRGVVRAGRTGQTIKIGRWSSGFNI